MEKNFIKTVSSTAHYAASELVDRLAQSQRETRNWTTDQDEAYRQVCHALNHCLDILRQTGCNGESTRLPSNTLWKIAGNILSSGVLQLHAREKPRGYAGDHIMLSRIASFWTCNHPLGQFFDRFFQDQAAPMAVRDRSHLIAAKILAAADRQATQRPSREFHLAAIGSGPAIEIELALRKSTDTNQNAWHIHLFDMDPAALAYAHAHLRHYISAANIHQHRVNLFRLPQNQTQSHVIPPIDFCYCAGLFDYLPTSQASSMLSTLWNCLRQDGSLLVFNFGPVNPSRVYMEWFGNWYLLYRTPEELQTLAESVPIPSPEYRVGDLQNKTIVYLEASGL